ncbi:MAG: endolytic transglycosylase MltG [Candidatus Amulumruptor caecigallinarius]|nr:endolytic transglycosylase MltG [Candidatus Amulumruptor caecigallinarius]MCM1397174.1 endolytic transglycosylase MltG [Candidatus Amulumruptor caecigallinarius]MCM1453137.1 endolytic transglycosylase MltG [bacterium]
MTTTPRTKTAKASAKRPGGKKSAKKKPRRGLSPVAWLFIGIGVLAMLACLWMVGLEGHRGESVWLKIPQGATYGSVRDSLRSTLGSSMGNRVYMLWRLQGGHPHKAHGAYEITSGRMALSTARALAKGRQTPVTVTFNNVRTMRQLADRLATELETTPEDFLASADTILRNRGFSPEEFPAVFMPDTYETYWTTSGGSSLTRKIYRKYRDFWDDERLAKAKALGLTPVQVATIASIVEEETAKSDERPMVARLYLNRFHKGMRLQADPTVKYAVGDFSLRRITGAHLKVQSPYNTYLNSGLPPGPIRMATAATIDQVLNAPEHDYLFMCAREDFSGYHNFATTYAVHQANARRYQAALNRRGIH